MEWSNRAVSPVISVILMIAVVVILAATMSVLFLGFAEDTSEPAPNIADTTGEFVPEPSSTYAGDNQIVQIKHLAGDSVAVKEIEIIVRASGHSLNTEARLVNLPSDEKNLESKNLNDPSNIIDDGDSTTNNIIIFDEDNTWSPGDIIQFRIGVGGADFREPSKSSNPNADKLKLIIIHTPSNAIISENTFRP